MNTPGGVFSYRAEVRERRAALTRWQQDALGPAAGSPRVEIRSGFPGTRPWARMRATVTRIRAPDRNFAIIGAADMIIHF
jgi:hypothetical protein